MKNEELLREYIRDSLRGEKPINEFFGISVSNFFKSWLMFQLMNKLTDHDIEDDGFAYKWMNIVSSKTGKRFSPYTQKAIINFVRNNQHQILDMKDGDTLEAAKILTNLLSKRFL